MAPDLLDLFDGARQANGSVSEPSLGCVDGDRRPVGGEESRAPGSDACPVAGFERSQALFGELIEWAAGEEALGLEHSQLEARLAEDARELARQLLQDQLDLRARVEQRADGVIGSDGTPRRSVERGHERDLHTVLGEVQVTRLAYRAAGSENLYPADAQLNLPPVRHSHGIRRLAALEAPRSSFEDGQAAIVRQTGQQIGTRQLRELTLAAAQDVGAFYAQRERTVPDGKDLLVLSCDAKGVVMRPEALREQTRTQAQNASSKLKTRLSEGEKTNRKRMAEIVTVYELTPEPRTAAEILPDPDNPPAAASTRPKAKNKWLKASVTDDARAVIAEMFNEADRRDPEHKLTWVALVDGNNHQIDRIKAEARKRKITIPIVVDFIHVLEYLWSGCWCFFAEGDPAAERWVSDKARQVLDGRAGIVAAAIRRKATTLGLDANQRKNADRCADYLLAKRPYLDYPTALTTGSPIATGVIEGACRHLVKDRMDITGARWGLAGAEAILTLRALITNGDFDQYWTFHLAQEHRRVHAAGYALGVIPAPA
ncbi:MAG TPA: ISKra4 family transposase [Candidatus Dormibacteraeota bacterium]